MARVRVPPRHARTASAAVLLALASLALGCGVPGDPDRPTYDNAFQSLRTVALDTALVATIGQPQSVLQLDSAFLVADGMSSRILRFGLDGSFERAFGRIGDGPGELRRPLDLLQDSEGNVLVADFGRKLVELTPDLEFVGEYPLVAPDQISRFERVGDRILASTGGSSAHNLGYWSPARGLHASFDERNALESSVPYWNATWATRFAVGANAVYVADNMLYPLRRYSRDGEFQDTIASAPASWRQARRPARGEFATQGPESQEKWFTSFSLVDGLFVVRDAWLVVTHRDRINSYSSDDVIRADVYALPAMTRRWTDVELPGPAMGGGECLWVQSGQPPSPWMFDCVVPR